VTITFEAWVLGGQWAGYVSTFSATITSSNSPPPSGSCPTSSDPTWN
jgi:hypothetical protein